LDPALPRRLASCWSETDPKACQFEVAEAYADAYRVEDAALILREIALLSSKSDMSIRAGLRYLEHLEWIGEHADSRLGTCYSDVWTDSSALKARYCSPPDADNKEACTTINNMVVHGQYLLAETLVIEANTGSPDAVALHRRAGELFMDLFDQYCAFRRPGKGRKAEPPPGWLDLRNWGSTYRHRGCDQVGYSALKSFEAAMESTLAKSARAALLDPVNQLTETSFAKKAAAYE
jgi:hypothetical protein